ncbi:MAG TPA: hypothetical protein VFM21_08945 [Terriglobia bacterium]|nr:hypothetical protein [Terriglobia bacterium]
MKILRAAVYLNLVLLAASARTFGQATLSSEPAKSCREVAQDFYDWYVPIVLKEQESDASDVALRDKPSVFSPELIRALNEDSQAQQKADGDLVGLDFDPFLNTQDPAQHYVLRDVSAKGDKCLVDVHSIDSGRTSPKPNVVAELARKDGKWRFVNFHYGKSQWSADENLIDTLKKLREDREQHK